jgi:UDP-N-acetyl-2-amino-2-deoxyglucuronate dehydrogenase
MAEIATGTSVEDDEQPLGFGVVGLGMGKHHCRSVTAAKGARLVAICDVRQELADKVAAEYGCKAYYNFDELLLDPEIDVVNIALPTGMHADAGIKAAQAGKHIICEKPLDVNLNKADALIAAAHEHHVKLGGIFQRRLHPVSKKIRETIRSGRLGRIYYADIHLYWWRAQSYYDGGWPAGWHGTWALDGGGSVMNQGVHSVDFIQWAVSPVKRIMARTGTFAHNIECEDVGMALVEFENGAIGNIVCTTAAYPGYSNDFHVFGEHGSIIVRNDSEVVSWRIKGPNEQADDEEMRRMYPGGRGTPSSDPMAVGFDGHTQEIEDMVHAIRDDRKPVIPGEEARHAIEIILAIQKSAETGQWVTLPDPELNSPTPIWRKRQQS